MIADLSSYEVAYDWAAETQTSNLPHLLLGNGFSVAYDRTRFSYDALLNHVRSEGLLSEMADKLFAKSGTYDFEVVIHQISNAATALEIIDAKRHRSEISKLRREEESLKELLAKTLASLHPERPSDVTDEAYRNVKSFINRHKLIYTTNYDLLLYWTLMHEDEAAGFKQSDDGFRSSDPDADYVVWDHLHPHSQSIHHLHGALHLYRDHENAELQKLTWVRTGDALIDQIRRQLHSNRFPLIVAEGTSSKKLSKIQMSDYLSKGLRSLAAIGGGILTFGLSFGENDAHISKALVSSKVSRMAVSIYGDPATAANGETIHAANRLAADRLSRNPKRPLEIKFFQAQTVPLW